MDSKTELKQHFGALSFEEKHFITFCNYFLSRNIANINEKFWLNFPNVDFIVEATPAFFEVMSCMLVEHSINFLKHAEALHSDSGTVYQKKFVQNSIIFDLESEENLLISKELIINLFNVYKAISRKKSHTLRKNDSEISQKNSTTAFKKACLVTDISGRNKFKLASSFSLYDFVLYHLICVNSFNLPLHRFFGSTQYEVKPDSVKLVQKLRDDSICASPFTVFSYANVIAVRYLFDKQSKSVTSKIVNSQLEPLHRLPFFYDYCINNWLSHQQGFRYIKKTNEQNHAINVFVEMLNKLVVDVKKREEYHLLELPIRFYFEFFKKFNITDWLIPRQLAMKDIRTMKQKSEFLEQQYRFFQPLEDMLCFLEELHTLSWVELKEKEQYFRQLPFAAHRQLRENLEAVRFRINRLLSGNIN